LFPQEQEIIFPPNSKFKLINKNKNCKYYNIDSDLAQKNKYKVRIPMDRKSTN